MPLPDSGNPDDYTPEQLEELMASDKAALTKNQKAAYARYNFKKQKEALAASGGAPAPAAKPAVPAAAKPAAAAPAAEAKPAPAAPKEDPKLAEQRERARQFAYAVELRARLGDKAEDLLMQRDKPYLVVKPAAVADALAAAQAMGFDHLPLLTACDHPPERIEMVYNLFSYATKQHLAVKARLPRAAPRVPSVARLWPGAEWLEREVYDMFGVRFDGLHDHRRLLLPESWVGYPLLKDYDATKEQYVAMDEKGDDLVSFEEAKGW